MDASSATTMALRVSSSASSYSSFKHNKSLPFKFSTFRPPPQPTPFKSLKCIQTTPPSSNPNPLKHPPPPPQNPGSASPFSCSAFTLSPSSQTAELVPLKLQTLISEFQSLPEPIDRVKRLLHYVALLPPFDDSGRVDSNRVMGCTARVWLQAEMDEEGKMRFAADNDSEITRGFCSCLLSVLDGASPEKVLLVKTDDLSSLKSYLMRLVCTRPFPVPATAFGASSTTPTSMS